MIFIFALVACVWPQNPQQGVTNQPSADWIRVRTDDGEFSIEVPVEHKYYFNHEGFINGNNDQFTLEDMVLLNSYKDETLLSIEKYHAKKGALDQIYESDTEGRKNIQKTELKRDGYVIREVVQQFDGLTYMVRRYFSSKTQIFILTAGSRTGVTASMRRFLDSMMFAPGKALPDVGGTVPFSTLKVDDITVEQELQDIKQPGNASANKPTTNNGQAVGLPLNILNKPRASYTNLAKSHQVVGTVMLRIKLTNDGFVSHIDVLKMLPDGLLRQCMIAAIRIKFLPKEMDGKPVSVEKIIDYSFDIY